MDGASAYVTHLESCLQRMRDGDPCAREELLRCACDRLQRLAQRMLDTFPTVRRWEQTEDVLQNALVRLLRALETTRPDNVRAFFALAAEQIRRELLDLARHYRGRQAHLAGAADSADAPSLDQELPDRTDAADDLEKWGAFHREVEKLPVEEREVVGLVFYHGWTQLQVAEVFQVNERTVRRWWQSAMQRLRHCLQDEDLRD